MIFIYPHIFKTGGTSFDTVLRRVFEDDKIVRVEDKDLSQYQGKDLLYGHMPFGLHRAIEEPCKYIGLVRDPVERVISTYYFMREQAAHPMFQICNRFSLLETLQPEFHEEIPYLSDVYSNHQTRIFAGITTVVNKNKVPCKFLNEEYPDILDLDGALLNIQDHYCFVSTMEDLDIGRLYKALGKEHSDVSFPHRGKTSNRIATSKIDPEALCLIQLMNRLDQHLYNHIQEKRT